jgi:hypothetical protein
MVSLQVRYTVPATTTSISCFSGKGRLDFYRMNWPTFLSSLVRLAARDDGLIWLALRTFGNYL